MDSIIKKYILSKGQIIYDVEILQGLNYNSIQSFQKMFYNIWRTEHILIMILN